MRPGMRHCAACHGLQPWAASLLFPRVPGVLASKMDENTSPELAMAKALTADATKRMLRRLSKDNTKQYGRHLGKISHSNPGTVFDTILSQVQGYDNMIVPIVDMRAAAPPTRGPLRVQRPQPHANPTCYSPQPRVCPARRPLCPARRRMCPGSSTRRP